MISTDLSTAVWVRDAPARQALEGFGGYPVFLGPAVGPSRATALWRAVRHAYKVARVLLSGVPANEILSFLLWIDTARFFAVERVLDGELHASPLNRLLPSPALKTTTAAEPISVAMIVQNEEANLPDALASVTGWAADIVVVDGGSIDKTAELAADLGARVVRRPFDGDFAAQRNFGLGFVTTPWVLSLDADERVPPELAEVLSRVASAGGVDGAIICILNIIDELGDEPWFWPDPKFRFFRSDSRYRGKLHESIPFGRAVVHLPLTGPYIVHRKSMSDHYRAELRYSEIDPTAHPAEYLQRIRRELGETDQVGE